MINNPKKNTRMHSSRMRIAPRYCRGDLRDRDPLDRDSLGQRTTPSDIDPCPPEIDPLERDLPHWTETLSPPRQRPMDRQTPVKT